MSHPSSVSPRRAFTLVEMLVVIAVMAILAALILNSLPGIWGVASTNRAVGEMQALTNAMEDYKIENVVFPQATGLASQEEPSADPNDYVASGRILFQALTGTNKFGTAPTGVVYFQPKASMIATEDDGNTGNHFFMDPWSYAYGYRSLDSGTVQGYNVGFFDLWSTGGGLTDDEDDLVKWIVNWKDPNYDRKTMQ